LLALLVTVATPFKHDRPPAVGQDYQGLDLGGGKLAEVLGFGIVNFGDLLGLAGVVTGFIQKFPWNELSKLPFDKVKSAIQWPKLEKHLISLTQKSDIPDASKEALVSMMSGNEPNDQQLNSLKEELPTWIKGILQGDGIFWTGFDIVMPVLIGFTPQVVRFVNKNLRTTDTKKDEKDA